MSTESASVVTTRERDGAVARVTINRPDVANAFDDGVILGLRDALADVAHDGDVRVVILASAGKHFSAGADLNWMKRAADYGHEENVEDAKALAFMLQGWDQLAKPVVGRIPGAAIGGGVGLVAVCDVVIASEKAKFGLSEVRLGLIPAVISPFVARKIGRSQSRALFLTAERFGAERALAIGLVHQVTAPEELDAAVEATVDALLLGAPGALAAAKELVCVALDEPFETLPATTAKLIADRRDSVEGREGMRAFLEKRKPVWVPPATEDA